MIDVETLLLLVGSLTLLLAVMLAVAYRGKRDRSASYWIAGCAAFGAALFLVVLRPYITDWLGYAVAVNLVAGSSILFGYSLRFLADPSARRDMRCESALAVFAVVYCIAQYLGWHEAQHFMALVAIAATAFWASAESRVAARKLDSQPLAFMQYLFIGTAVAWLLRIPAAYVFDFRIMNDPTPGNTLILLASLAFAVIRHLLYLTVRLGLSYERSLDRAITREAQTRQQMLASLNALALARDNETGNHILRTQHYARRIACRLRDMGHFSEALTDRKIDLIFDAAPLHDIGKVGIPDHILLKKGPLDESEWAIMKTHTTIGESVLRAADTELHGEDDVMTVAIRIAGSHHEKWDGSGYPRGLVADAIPLEARIMSIVDMYDALMSVRPYKRKWTHEEATAEILRRRGQFFDPRVVEAFEAEQAEFARMALQYQD